MVCLARRRPAHAGAQRWKLARRDPLVSDPAVADGVTYIAANDTVYAVGAAAGTRRWTFVVDEELDTPPTLLGGVLVVCGVRWVNGNTAQVTTLYAVDTTTGRERWKVRTPHGVRTLAAAGGLIYAGVFQDALYALDAGTGKRRWSFPTGNYDYMWSPTTRCMWAARATTSPRWTP
ncbi:PQQ-binding-like beta-propeller repeat protein [Streptomyces cinerochromogenes]|uniref:PQQ-binding-like beta-propeller repeat protein n=1 Tax=Streptomyces cinerochromogenes TaxID=66422 RepID=A0ABW7B9R2_9ACTN